MAEAKTQAEPTMEEILASIRRIISEDDPAEQDASAPTDDEPEAEAQVAEAGAAEAEVAEAEVAEAEVAGDAGTPAAAADDVLELTQKLNDDGTVVDLAKPPAATNGATPPEPAPEPAPEPEPEMAAAEPAPEPEPEPEQEVAAASEPEPEAEPEAEPEMAAKPEPEPEPEPELAAEPDPFADVAVAAPADDAESILAPEIQVATTSALGAVGKAVAGNRQGPVQVGDGRTLEDIVREALTPELKAWLDANLAPLVEQIVREEIKKMVRRAEDQ